MWVGWEQDPFFWEDSSASCPPCSYIPCSERIHLAVTEMAALFPKVSNLRFKGGSRRGQRLGQETR